jgi:hypothetical protein
MYGQRKQPKYKTGLGLPSHQATDCKLEDHGAILSTDKTFLFFAIPRIALRFTQSPKGYLRPFLADNAA